MNRRLVATLLAAVLAATAIAAAAALPAHAAKHMEVGIQDDGAFVSEIGLKRSKALKLAARLEVTRIRVNVPWAKVVKHPNAKKKPKHRRYDFAAYDALLKAARRKGIRLQLTITGFAPAWATGNHRTGGYRPKMGPWNDFVRAVVKHFRRYSDRYSIWNEPNYHTWLSPLGSAPKLYHSLYTRAYKIIRHNDPSAKILIGETAPYGQSKGRSTPPLYFIRKLVSYGRLRADGFAHHPYDYRHSIDYRYPGSDNVTMSGLGRLTRELRHLASAKRLLTSKGKPLPVYLTEYGYMRSGKYGISESRRAKYLTRAFQMALENSHVKEMTQYLLVRPPWHDRDFDSGLVSRHKGTPTKTFHALEHWAKREAKKHRIKVPTPPR